MVPECVIRLRDASMSQQMDSGGRTRPQDLVTFCFPPFSCNAEPTPRSVPSITGGSSIGGAAVMAMMMGRFSIKLIGGLPPSSSSLLLYSRPVSFPDWMSSISKENWRIQPPRG